MTGFRALLVVVLTTIVVYTAIVIANHGIGLVPIFFGDMAEMEWPGQCNLDFAGFLAWRHHLAPLRLASGVLGIFGGAPVLAAYLLVTSYSVDANVAERSWPRPARQLPHARRGRDNALHSRSPSRACRSDERCTPFLAHGRSAPAEPDPPVRREVGYVPKQRVPATLHSFLALATTGVLAAALGCAVGYPIQNEKHRSCQEQMIYNYYMGGTTFANALPDDAPGESAYRIHRLEMDCLHAREETSNDVIRVEYARRRDAGEIRCHLLGCEVDVETEVELGPR